MIYTNQPGLFPKKLSKGNQYIMVLTHIDSSAIHMEAMKNRTAGKMICAYQGLINRLLQAEVTPKQHILDNKCSEEFKATIHKYNMTFQLVPPHDHRRNIAEKAIQTFKGHFISILCGTDKISPCTYGVVFSHRLSIPSPCCKAHELHQMYQLMQTFRDSTTSMQTPLHH